LVDTVVVADRAVAVRTQRDDPGGTTSGERPVHAMMDDRVRPFPVDVDVVPGRVEIPGAHARRAAADLAETQTLGTEEPFHVRRRRADAERLDGAQAQLAHLR